MTEHRQVCYHSSDAVAEGDEYVFDGPQLHGVQRVVLGSMELPLAQATIEARDALCYHEGYDAVAGADVVNVEVFLDDGSEETLEIAIARRCNRVRSVQTEMAMGSMWVVVECVDPHRLVDEHQHSLVVALPGSPLPRLLGGLHGDLPLEHLQFVSSTCFKARCAPDGAACGQRATHVHVPPAASAAVVCDRLTRASMALPLRVSFRHDAGTDGVHATAQVGDASWWTSVRSVRLQSTPLAHTLQLPCNLTMSAPLPIAWPAGGPTCLWGRIRLRPGNYAPARISTATLPPRRFVVQLEEDANALFVPPSSEENAGAVPKIVFVGGDGVVCACAPPPGRYVNARAYLTALGAAMTTARTDAGEVYEVACDGHGVVSFRCMHRTSATPVVFALHFHHPRSLDADRFGFEAQSYVGHSVYTGTRAARFPELPAQRAPLHLLRASETPLQHLCLQATPPPALCATVEATVAAHGRTDAVLVARTELQGAPFAHGWGEGTTVRLGALDDAMPPVWCTVLIEPAAPGDDGCLLRVCAPAEWRGGVVLAGARFVVRAEPRPWGLQVGVSPHSLPAPLLGFPRGAVHALGGAPMISPYAFDLEPPPYLLLTLSHAGGGGSVVHTFGGFETRVFAKLVLSVQHREFGSQLKDEAPTSSRVQRFRVGLRNPDGSPYQLHGRTWSFSLVYVLDATEA